MALGEIGLDQVESCRLWLESALSGDERFKGRQRCDRSDGSTLAIRWQSAVNDHVWFEVAVRPAIPQVRVGILTDDRWKSEEFEQKIQESGDTMSEFVELGFEEIGLEWTDPLVEHYREDTKYFYFATTLEIDRLDELGDEAVRTKIRRMVDGYHQAFGPYLEG